MTIENTLRGIIQDQDKRIEHLKKELAKAKAIQAEATNFDSIAINKYFVDQLLNVQYDVKTLNQTLQESLDDLWKKIEKLEEINK